MVWIPNFQLVGIQHKPWDIEILNSNNCAQICSAIQTSKNEEEWDEFGGCGEYLASCLEVGDNFTVNVEKNNEEDADFYIVFCTQAIQIVRKDFMDVEDKFQRK